MERGTTRHAPHTTRHAPRTAHRTTHTAHHDTPRRFDAAYYRRASGNFALGKYKLALKDFKTVCKMVPKDKQARAKYKECDKAVKEAMFAAAIVSEETAPFSMDPTRINVDPNYDGPIIDEETGIITIEFVQAMVERFRDQKMIHRKYVVMILNQMTELLETLPNCTPLQCPTEEGSKFTVCGDIHGQFYDLLNIFAINGEPSPSNPYLFNGDFVDRGSFSLECILTLFAYKLVYPSGLHMTRGNHESKNMTKIYGFEGEVGRWTQRTQRTQQTQRTQRAQPDRTHLPPSPHRFVSTSFPRRPSSCPHCLLTGQAQARC